MPLDINFDEIRRRYFLTRDEIVESHRGDIRRFDSFVSSFILIGEVRTRGLHPFIIKHALLPMAITYGAGEYVNVI